LERSLHASFFHHQRRQWIQLHSRSRQGFEMSQDLGFLVRVISYNLASDNEGPQWRFGADDDFEGDISLHHVRTKLLKRELHAKAWRPVEKAEDVGPGHEPMKVLPVICLQESVLPLLDGFEMVSSPGTKTHAGFTTLFVPNKTWRDKHGVVLEEAASAGPDHPQGNTYDFPMVSLLVPAADGTLSRVAVASVHLTPFWSGAPRRRKQLLRVSNALTSFCKRLCGRDRKTAIGTRNVLASLMVVAGDCNMRDDEEHPDPVVFRDGFRTWEEQCPEEAHSAKHTWDTSTNYNGPPSKRGTFRARYDRVYYADGPTNLWGLKEFDLLGTKPFVCREWDDLEELAVDVRRNFGDSADPETNADLAVEFDRISKAATAAASDLLNDPARLWGTRTESHLRRRYLSDHFGVVATFAL
jgi:hypothetical protein